MTLRTRTPLPALLLSLLFAGTWRRDRPGSLNTTPKPNTSRYGPRFFPCRTGKRREKIAFGPRNRRAHLPINPFQTMG
jgi:hypothetical protein